MGQLSSFSLSGVVFRFSAIIMIRTGVPGAASLVMLLKALLLFSFPGRMGFCWVSFTHHLGDLGCGGYYPCGSGEILNTTVMGERDVCVFRSMGKCFRASVAGNLLYVMQEEV